MSCLTELRVQPPVREKVVRRHVRVLVNLLVSNVHQDLFTHFKRRHPQRRQLEDLEAEAIGTECRAHRTGEQHLAGAGALRARALPVTSSAGCS